jgi:hypothetical protein
MWAGLTVAPCPVPTDPGTRPGPELAVGRPVPMVRFKSAGSALPGSLPDSGLEERPQERRGGGGHRGPAVVVLQSDQFTAL